MTIITQYPIKSLGGTNMEILNWEYVFYGAVLPIVIVIVFLILSTYVSRKLFCRKSNSFLVHLPLLLWFIVIIYLLFDAGSGFKYPAVAWAQGKTSVYATTGQVTKVYDAPIPPVYYNRAEKAFAPAKIVVVDAQEYYALAADVQTGDCVRIEWSTALHIVYSIKKIDPSDINTATVMVYNPGQQKQNNTKAAHHLQVISFLMLFVRIILENPIGRKLAPYYIKRDRLVTGKIVPNRLGIIYHTVMFAPFILFGIGIEISNHTFGGLIATLGVVFLLLIILLNQTTKVELHQNVLIYKYLHIVEKIPVEDIDWVKWKISKRFPCNRRLIIKLKIKGSLSHIVLNQTGFWGLENMYDLLKGQGDGLREPF